MATRRRRYIASDNNVFPIAQIFLDVTLRIFVRIYYTMSISNKLDQVYENLQRDYMPQKYILNIYLNKDTVRYLNDKTEIKVNKKLLSQIAFIVAF